MSRRLYRVPLSQGKFALVDEEDYEWMMQYKWCASHESRGTKWYAIRWATDKEYGDGKRYKIRMHRFIKDLPPGVLDPTFIVDHLCGVCHLGHRHTGSGLDNRRCGLEIITQAENMRRSAGWKKKKEVAPEPFL